MDEDGSLNTVLWRDFSERSLVELARETKALTRTHYATVPEPAFRPAVGSSSAKCRRSDVRALRRVTCATQRMQQPRGKA